MPEDYALNLEEMKRMMANARGTNLAGQSMAGPVATGQAYAQQIAGGMPMEQVIAPGVSYSPEMAGGYTQADLDMIARGPAPVMPVAPTTGEVATIEDQMPFAPPGVQEPTRFMPFMQNLDFSNLPRYEDIRDIRSYEDIRPTLFDIDVEEILKDIDLINMDMPSIAPTMPQVPVQAPMNFTGLPQMPSMPIEPMVQPITAPVMPTKVLPQPIFANAPRPQPLPMPFIPGVEEIVSPISRGRTRQLPQPGLFSLV
jgi:hypothetical protein